MMTSDQMYQLLAEFDELDAVQEKFVKEVTGTGGAGWAIERYAEQVIFARQMARIVRPLLEAYGKVETDVWMAEVKNTYKDVMRRLVSLHGRHNSTSVLSNAINQWEAEAMSRFIQRLDYVRW